MKKSFLSIAIASALLSACGGSGTVRNPQADAFADRCTVERTGEKRYLLDDGSSNSIAYLQYIHNDTLPLFSFLNTYSNSIYLYDAKEGTLLDTIFFEKEGADGVGEIQGYCYHNADSIYVYAYGSGRVQRADRSGKVAKHHRLFDPDAIAEDTTQFLTSPYAETRTPLLYRDGKLIMSGGFFAETTLERADNTFVTLLYDEARAKVNYANPYPEQYRKYDWGGGFFYRQPSVALAGTGELLISFPADHRLWRYNLQTGVRDSLYAGSRVIKEIAPFSTEKKMFPDDVPEHLFSEWYYSQSSYEGIYTDPYKQLYYRIARLPNASHRAGTFNDKPVVVIVLDRELNYLGEEQLPSGVAYDTFNAYVSPEGLHIHIRDAQDAEHLIFYTYNAKL